MERDVTLIAFFAALIAALGLIPAIPLGFGVPITAQNLGVMLCGTVLGARRGALSVLLFLGLVALGLPLLSGGRGGLGVFTGPTAGFLVGWVVSAIVAGLIVRHWRGVSLTVSAGVGALVGAVVVSYAFGIVWLAHMLGRTLVEATGMMLVFIPGDVIKAVIAGFLTASIYKARPHMVLSRR